MSTSHLVETDIAVLVPDIDSCTLASYPLILLISLLVSDIYCLTSTSYSLTTGISPLLSGAVFTFFFLFFRLVLGRSDLCPGDYGVRHQHLGYLSSFTYIQLDSSSQMYKIRTRIKRTVPLRRFLEVWILEVFLCSLNKSCVCKMPN